MAAPFSGFVVPPWPYLAILGTIGAAILLLLYMYETPIREATVLGFAPWMVSGAALHVFYLLGEMVGEPVYPAALNPLFSAPTVYLTTFVVASGIWVLSLVVARILGNPGVAPRYLGLSGLGVAVILVTLLVFQAMGLETLSPVIPILTVIAAAVLTFVVYIMLGTWRTYILVEARYVGALVLFAHVLDGLSTAVGVDVLGRGERSAVPRAILEFSAGLPTEPYLGVGWLFLVVKVLVAVVVIVLFADYVRERPSEGNLLFGLVAAVGLGPATNNLLLFMLGVA
jgi:uncharacterized membrane protein